MDASGAPLPIRRKSNPPGKSPAPQELLAIFDLSQTIVRRLDGTILFCSTGVSRLYGWPKEEMIGKSSHVLLQTEFPISLERINSHLLTHGLWTGKLKHVRRDGSIVRVVSHWALQNGRNGNPDFVVEMNTEIAEVRPTPVVQRTPLQDATHIDLDDLNRELHKAVDERTRLEEMLASICAMTGAGAGSVLVLHPEAERLEVAAIYGLSSGLLERALGATNAWEVVRHNFANAGEDRPISAAKRGEAGSRIDELRPPGYGSAWPAALRYEENQLLGILMIYFEGHEDPSEHDLWILETYARLASSCLERINARSALRQSEHLNRQIIASIPDCIFVLDVTADGRFKFVQLNPAEERAVGLSNARVSGKFIEEFLPEEVVVSVTAQYRRCIDAGVPIDYEGELNLAIGRRYFRTHLIPMRDAIGRIYRLVGCCHDLTDSRRLHEEALARQKLETVGALASGVAHDFNNLLGGILTSAELALSEKTDRAAVEEELRRIRTASVRGGEIVRELMTYAGKERAVREAVDLSALVEEMLHLLQIAVSKNAVFEARLRKNLPAVQANPTQLRQVVMNLVTNASDAIGNNKGVIRVVTSVAKIGENSNFAGNLAPGDYLKLEVSDTGPGIPPELRAKVFDPFFTTKRDGRGIGLSMVQGIVRSHNGAIRVTSTPGQGATFQVFLPQSVENKHQRKQAALPTAAQLATQPATILVVEDEEHLRAAVAKALRRYSFQVIEAADGSAAVGSLNARKDSLDIVLLDVTLPGMSSHDTYEHIQRIHPGVKVIFTSAYCRDSVDATLKGLPVERFIRKPFQLADLVAAIQAAIAE